MYRSALLPLLIATGVFATACSPVRRLLPQEELLTRVSVVVDGKNTSDESYTEVVQQWPNRSLLGWKAYLALYNIPARPSEKPMARLFRRIGEAPVVLDG
jgi:hypothetical protein